ncbi:MAG: site-2 protease family protein [Thermoleophilia bacterium]|nr:site-2 protease family protein [Thermoleophilia bacterium]
MNQLELFVYLLPVLLAAMTLHELAHAYTATYLGDPTPREHGRLTLNPLAHLDPLGTGMFVVTYFLSSFVFGWAKPVLVQPQYFRRPKQAMALVAVAGPVTNFLVALACVALLVHREFGEVATNVLLRSYEINLVLGIFNLLPIPPLDGSRIVGALMSDAAYVRWSALDQYGMLAVFALIVFFREEFAQVIGGAFEHSTTVMVTLVGG